MRVNGLPRNTTQCAQIGLEPGPLNLTLIALKDHSLITGCGGWVGEEKLGGGIEKIP